MLADELAALALGDLQARYRAVNSDLNEALGTWREPLAKVRQVRPVPDLLAEKALLEAEGKGRGLDWHEWDDGSEAVWATFQEWVSASPAARSKVSYRQWRTHIMPEIVIFWPDEEVG